MDDRIRVIQNGYLKSAMNGTVNVMHRGMLVDQLSNLDVHFHFL